MTKIVLAAAAGSLGSSVLRHLLALVSPFSLVLALHNPDQAPEWIRRCGAQLCKVDYGDPPSLDAAFEGAAVVLIVSHPSIEHEHRFAMHKNAIDAAVRRGVRHIFYTSLAYGGNLETKSLAYVMQAHLSTEAYLASIAKPLTAEYSSTTSSSSSSTPKDGGVTYTAIREGLCSETYPLYFGFFDPEHPCDEVALPDDGDGGVAWASRDDLAEATAKLIHSYAYEAECFPYLNEVVLLTGAEALPLSRVAEVLGRLLNRPQPIDIKRVSVDDYVERYAEEAKLDRHVGGDIRRWATVYEAIRAGECSVVTSTLEDWLGRKPETFEQTIRKSLLQLARSPASER